MSVYERWDHFGREKRRYHGEDHARLAPASETL